MQTTPDLVAAARAELLARLIYNDDADQDARRALEHVERVAQVVGRHRQRAILWLRHILNHEKAEPHVLIAFGFDTRMVTGADTLGLRPRESLRDHAKRVAACQDSDVLSLAVAALDDRISAHSGETDHPFRWQTDHPFRRKPITRSDANRSPVGAKRRGTKS